MCPYFNVNTGVVTTSSTTSFAKSAARLVTIANQPVATVTQIQVGGQVAAGTTLCGVGFYLSRYTTPSTGGTTVTPAAAYPGNTANTLAYTGAITLGSTQTIVKTIVCGVGGPGAWAAESPAAGESMLANGGANGNFDLQTICATASQSFLAGIDFNEGLY